MVGAARRHRHLPAPEGVVRAAGDKVRTARFLMRPWRRAEHLSPAGTSGSSSCTARPATASRPSCRRPAGAPPDDGPWRPPERLRVLAWQALAVQYRLPLFVMQLSGRSLGRTPSAAASHPSSRRGMSLQAATWPRPTAAACCRHAIGEHSMAPGLRWRRVASRRTVRCCCSLRTRSCVAAAGHGRPAVHSGGGGRRVVRSIAYHRIPSHRICTRYLPRQRPLMSRS
jgi:hypothetical protein